jgi:hypothetical protein
MPTRIARARHNVPGDLAYERGIILLFYLEDEYQFFANGSMYKNQQSLKVTTRVGEHV